ncbi:MAG TPA: hypothetical protein PKK12_00130 [Candidatus Aminicenantes bacterium]|nr:hypothetical protein [Candidatus Aminicenantes bacterium]
MNHRLRVRRTAWIALSCALLALSACGPTEDEIQLAPYLAASTPYSADNTGDVVVTVTGAYFQTGANLLLQRPSDGALIHARDVTVTGGTTVSGTFTLTGSPTALCDVIVMNPDSRTGRLSSAFQITQPTVLYAAGDFGRDVSAFHHANTLTGAAVPDRRLTHAVLGQPGAVLLDATRNLLYVTDWPAGEVHVFADGASVDGGAAPLRTITSSAYAGSFDGLALDEARNELYVASYTHGVVLVFAAASASGDTVPVRVISGAALQNVRGLCLDTANNRLYACRGGESGGAIHVFDLASSRNGEVAPSRTITGPLLASMLEYVWVDPYSDRLYATLPSFGRLLCYDRVSILNGEVAPSVVITLPGQPAGIWQDSLRNILYVADYAGGVAGAGAIWVFDAALTMTSAAQPARTITGLTSPKGLWGTNI